MDSHGIRGYPTETGTIDEYFIGMGRRFMEWEQRYWDLGMENGFQRQS